MTVSKYFNIHMSLSGNYHFWLSIDGDRFFKGSLTVNDNNMGEQVIKTGGVDVDDILNIYYWLHSNQYNSFNAYGGVKIALVEFGEFVDSTCKSIKVLDTIIEYLDNITYGGFDYSSYSEDKALEEFERGCCEIESWRERDL